MTTESAREAVRADKITHVNILVLEAREAVREAQRRLQSGQREMEQWYGNHEKREIVKKITI